MSIVDIQFRLPEDVEAVPDPGGSEVIAARPGSRFPPQVLSADAWTLLELFRQPSTLSAAIIGYCEAHGGDPISILDEAFPVLVALTRTDLLVPDGDAATALAPRHATGERVGPAHLGVPIRVLRDGELWDATLDDGSAVVVKVIDEPTSGPELFLRETTALRRLAGGPVPDVLWKHAQATGGVLVLGWVDGDPADLAALDASGTLDVAAAMTIVLSILDAYVAIHAAGVWHGDIHPGNVLVDARGTVGLIDFGIAEVTGAGLGPAPRTAGGEQLDPQAAAALLHDQSPAPLDAAAEVYALATLAYRIVTGSAPLDLELPRSQALEAIIACPPRPFSDVGRPPWPAVEQVLARGLAKDPAHRPASARQFRDALALAADTSVPAASVTDASPGPPVGEDGETWLAEWDVDAELWGTADAAAAASTSAALLAIAAATGDVDAHDLALLWSVRAGSGAPTLDASVP